MMKPEDLKHINELHLHDIKMGKGSIWVKDKVIVICVGTYKTLLPCGCPGSENIKVSDEKGNQCYEKIEHFDPKGFKYVHGSLLQSKDWDSYWVGFYQRYPYLKPFVL